MTTIQISRDAVEQALLPCPFCGGLPKTTERPDNINGTEFFFAVACYCGGYSATAHKMAVRKTPEQAKRDAVDAWNTRAALAQADRPAVPQPCNHAFVKTTMVFDHETRVQEAACMHCGAKPEPQAQAGEPEVVVLPEWTANMDDESAIARFIRDNEPAGPDADEFRQQLRDAIQEAIAKKDAEAAELRAALVGCEKDAARYRFIRDANRSDVIAFELRHYAMETLDEYVDAAMDGELDAAITQAQEVLKC